MLELRDVSLLYNPGSATETLALDSVSLVIPTGQFVTVVGSNGAGKSSMIKVVSGAERPTRGTVHIAGEDVTALSDYRRAGKVARVFDNPQLGTAPDLSIEDNMALALSRGHRRRPAGRHHIAGGSDRRHALPAPLVPHCRSACSRTAAVCRHAGGAGASGLAGRRRCGALVLGAGGRHRVPGDWRVIPCRERTAHADAARPGDPCHQPDLPDPDIRRCA